MAYNAAGVSGWGRGVSYWRGSASDWLALVALIGFALYVWFALTPSSYAIAFDALGMQREGLVLGTPRSIRSDEWMVYTPYVQIAVANGLGPINELSPYHESLRSFQALPILDWAMVFKPYHWGFLVLPAANAYSFFFALMAFAFITGWALFLRQLRVPPTAALIVSATLFFSPFVQVWWSSNAGVFALGPWVAVAWLHFERRWLRIAMSAYALTVWMLSNAYPPFLYSTGVAMGVLIFALRRDKLTWARLFDATAAGTIALSIFIGYFHDLIDVMQNTVYPGRRQSLGGGTEWAKLVAHLSPGLTTRGYEPLTAFRNTNACEIAVLSSLLPLYTTLVDRQRLARWADQNQATIAIFVAGLMFFTAWIFLPVSAMLAKLTGLFMVPPARALLGLGLLVNIGCAFLIANCGTRVTPKRLAVLLIATLAATALKLAFSTEGAHDTFSYPDLVPYACLLIIAPGAYMPGLRTRATGLVLAAALVGNMLAYGGFNPVQSAKPIFAMDKERVEKTLSQHGAEKSADGIVVAPGHYGALLAGIGIPAVNHVLYHPELGFFRHHFPQLPKDQFNLIFNRYAHVSVGAGTNPQIIAPDHIQIPANVILGRAPPLATDKAGIEMLKQRPPAVPADALAGHMDTIGPLKNGSVTLQGWFHAKLDCGTYVRVWTSAQPSSAALETIKRPDVAATVDAALLDSGAALTISFDAQVSETEICLDAIDADNRVTSVRFPNGDWGCTQLPSIRQ